MLFLNLSRYGKLQQTYPIFASVTVTTLFDYPSVNMLLKLMENLLGYTLTTPSQRKIEVPLPLATPLDASPSRGMFQLIIFNAIKYILK